MAISKAPLFLELTAEAGGFGSALPLSTVLNHSSQCTRKHRRGRVSYDKSGCGDTQHPILAIG
jgi:hypothetical protein